MKYNSCLSYKRVFLLLLHYFGGYLFLYPLIATIITLRLDPYAVEYPVYIQVILYLFVFLIAIVLAKPLLKKAVATFLSKPIQIIKDTLIRFGWLYLSMIVCNIILLFLLPDSPTSNNQQEILNSLIENPALTTIVTVIFAPVVEEIIFRGCLYGKLREIFNYRTCLVISSFTFGFLHIYQSLLSGDFLDCFYILTYAVMGIQFGILYEKHNSIVACMLLHCMNNTLATLMMVLF